MLIISLFILLIYSSVINTSESLLTNNKNIIKIGLLILSYSLFMIIDNISYYNNNILLFNDLYILNTYNIYFISLIYIIAMSLITINIINITSINNNNLLIHNLNNFNRYYITIILFNIIGIILFITSNNLISIFIGIELQSYSLYILTGLPPKSNTSAHNSLFYYLIGGFGSIIILYGISLLYYTSGNIYLNNINLLLDYESFRNSLLIGYLFIIFGLLIKIGAGPMYNWSILLYMNSHTIITSYISIIPKLSILTYIWYLYHQLNISSYDININNIDNKIILIFSLIISLSLIIGSISGLSQIKIKSILAYSGLLNIGYLLLSILINNINSLTAYIIYITQYSIGHVSMFLLLIIAAVYNNNNHLIYTYEIKSIYKNSFLITSLLIIIGSFIGIPPLFGFYGKYYLLISSINTNYLFLSLLLIISSIIATLYYLYIINSVISDNENKDISNSVINIISVGNTLSYVFSSFIMILLFNFIQWNNILKGAYIIATYI